MKRFLSFSFIGSALDVVRALVTARLLGPNLAGLCHTLLAIPQIGQYLNLGLIESMTVHVPHYRGENNHPKAATVQRTVLGLTLMISLSAFSLVTAYILFFWNETAMIKTLSVLAASLILFWELKQFLVTQYTLDNRLKRLAWVELTFSLAVTLFQIVGIYFLGVFGFWIGFILANLVVISLSGLDYLSENHGTMTKPDFREAARMVPLGLVMLISSASCTPFLILSRLFLAGSVGTQEVGYFILTSAIIGKAAFLPFTISRVLVPRMSGIHAETGSTEGIFNLYERSQIYTFVGILLTLIPSWFLLQPLVKWILPAYTPGIPAAKIALLAIIPYCLIDNANNVLFALKQKGIYLRNLALTLLFQASTLLYLKLSHQISATSVSLSLLATFIVLAALANFKVIRWRRDRIVECPAT